MRRILDQIKEQLELMKNRKLLTNVLAILILGIIILLIANIITGEKKDKGLDSAIEDIKEYSADNNLEYDAILEKKLENILTQMKGVEKVRVMITLEDTSERVPAFNTTQNNETTNEVDSQGGTREVFREDTTTQVVTESEGSLTVIKEIKPTVKGVIVIAEGAEDLEVKERLYEAVKTVLGIPGNRVEVYSSE
ncbi:MAG TPA: sporulation stage III protein AG [Tepidimicrobium sp.]|nr:sporulation stage III protein AG [Tepidimicrobium sp.]